MRVNPQNFINDIPSISRFSPEYIPYWAEQRKRCIEGYWHSGFWMPPSLYFYVNFGTIRLNKKNSNAKHFARPWLRDLEWQIFQAWTVAQGFSGFEKDEKYSCNRLLLDNSMTDEELKDLDSSTFNSLGERKIYEDPTFYINKNHGVPLGKALYNNEAKNLMILGSRDTGKSYMVGVGIVLHQFLFDNLKTYAPSSSVTQPTEVTVGAELAHYSTLMLNKTKEALDLLPGSHSIAGRTYPSPFFKQYKGSWSPGSQIKAEYKKKIPGGWDTRGSRSTIKHRTFNDNPFADQGSRPSAIVLEEIGMFSLLKEVYYNTKDNLRDGLRKTGSLVMLGTGGDMSSGTIAASQMFYEPDAYEILAFRDQWENKSNIGFFIPAMMSLNAYKDEWYYTKHEEALSALQKSRDKIRTSGSSQDLNKEMQYRPIIPSEMFISRSANIFPAPELRARLSELTSSLYKPIYVDLFFDSSKKSSVSHSVKLEAYPITSFPHKQDNLEGEIEIHEFPLEVNGVVPPDAYIIGCDPFKEDAAQNGSLAAIYVLKTGKYPQNGHHEIVASYVGRPFLGKNAVNETLYKLSLFYGGAKIYFENSVGNVKDYFEKIQRLDLLAAQPVTIFNKKAAYSTTQSTIYGYPMSNRKIKFEAIQYLRSFLLEERGEGLRNLDLIPDIPLLQELLAFDMETNTDRVMGLVGCILGLEETHNLNVRNSAEPSIIDLELDRLFINNKNLFYVNAQPENLLS